MRSSIWTATGAMTAVGLEMASGTIVAGRPQQLFATKYHPGFTSLGLDFRGYDVARDGQRFLMIKEPVDDLASRCTANGRRRELDGGTEGADGEAMNTERLKQIRDLVENARELPASEQPAFLERECAADPALRSDIVAFLEQPSTDTAAWR